MYKQNLLVLVVAFLFAVEASAMFMRPENAPIDRVIANATAYVKENPEDPQGYYVLGRVHFFAFASKYGQVPQYPNWGRPKPGDEDKAKLPNIPGDAHARPGETQEYMLRQAEAQRRAKKELAVDDVGKMSREQRQKYYTRMREIQKQLQEDKWMPTPMPQRELDEHARLAIKNFKKAIELNGKNGLYYNGLAGISEQFAQRAEATYTSVDGDVIRYIQAPPKGEHRDAMLNQALQSYKKAYELTIDKDSKLEHRPLAGLADLVSYEAIKGYKRVQERLEDEKADKALLEAKRSGKNRIYLVGAPNGDISKME